MRDLKPALTAAGEPSRFEESERQLILRCAAGDARAWRMLYEQHFPRVEHLVAALGIIDAEADDLCQEIFLLIYRHLPRFRGEARLATWIHRLATREAIRHAKRGRLRRTLAQLFARERNQIQPATSGESHSTANQRRYLEELLARLSPERRLAVVLYEIEGVAVAEIARISNCAESTIWTRLHRARGDLEKLAERQER